MEKAEIIAKIKGMVDLKRYPIIFRSLDRQDIFYVVSSFEVIDQPSKLYRLYDGFSIDISMGRVSRFLHLPGRFEIVVEDASKVVASPEPSKAVPEPSKAVAFFPEKPRRRRKTLNTS
jgi:hypothetical protein